MVFGNECLWACEGGNHLDLRKTLSLGCRLPPVYRLLVYDTGHINNAPINTNRPSIMAKA
jgi:hypothetical protein